MTERVGQQFGQYRLSRFLGQGSFGEVYLGEHIYHNNTLAAVKVLQARLTAEDLKEFITEASTTFRLQHPHIVRLLDFGIGPTNTPFLTMAYAPKGTLRQRYPKGTRLPLDSIIEYVRPIAAALQHAHNERLIHRDVKPENILLGPNDEVWLSDFGIVAIAHSTSSLDTEKPGGTVPYMAPEQLRGKARPASDQYALGVIVYEWLCGERPFCGTATEIAMQHFLEPPPSLCEKVSTVSREVEQVVLTALAKDPMARFASVQAFATALQAAAKLPPDARSAKASRVSVGGAPPSATASPVDGASPPGQTNERRVPPVPPPAVAGNLDASARVPLPGKQVPTTASSAETVASSPEEYDSFDRQLSPTTASSAETVASSPAPLSAERPSAVTHLPTDGRAASPASPSVAQGKMPLPSIPIAPGSFPAHVRLPRGRAMVLALLVLLVVSGSGIWAALYLEAHNASPTPANQVRHRPPTTPTATTQVPPSPSATPTIVPPPLSPYDQFVIKNGIQFGFDAQHSRFNPYESQLSPATVATLVQAWTASTGFAIDSSPAVANGVVYVGSDDGKLYAFKANGCGQPTCSPLWTAPTGSAIESSPAVANGVVYVGSYNGKLYAFKADGCGQPTCLPLWTATIGNYVGSSPAVANGVVYVGSDDDKLYAFKADGCGQPTCSPLWTASIGNAIWSSPAVANGVVYVGSDNGKLYAFKADGCGQPTCSPLWTATTGNQIDSSPAVANGVVYVGSDDGKLYAFKADGCGQLTCSPLWTATTGDRINSSPAVANGVVYVGSGVGYVGSYNDKLYAFKADGCGQPTCSPLWTATTGSAIDSSPAVANGVVYVGSEDHKLYAFKADGCGQPTCLPLWTATTGSAIDSSPAVANGVVYVGSEDHKLYAFRRK